MSTTHRFGKSRKTSKIELDSPYLLSGSKRGNWQYRRLGGLAVAAAILIVPILTLHKTPAATSALRLKSPHGATAPWEKTGGPPGIQTNVIFKANNVVYAGTETQGVYKSTDNGLSWGAANAGIERTSISDLIFSGGNLLAAGKGGCPTSLNVFKSTDNGATWTGTTGLNGRIVRSFAMKGSSIYAAVALFPGSSGVARSTDNGSTWQDVASPIENGGESIVSDDAIIIAEDNFIWRSTDDGASWDVVEQFALTGISSFARAGTKLFGAATTGIQTSTDNGASWSFEAFSNGAYSLSLPLAALFTSVPTARCSIPPTLGRPG
jgi:photosystem II stability/assembly factor-like uncharacterized protein